MIIANIILTSQNGGAEQVFLDYSAAFKKLGHEVVAVTKLDAPYISEVEALGISPYKIPNNFGYHDFFAIRNLAKILRENKVEAIFAHAGRATIIARKAINKIKDRKIFLISVNHSMNVKRSLCADIIISVNKAIFYRTIDAGRSPESSFVIHNSVDLLDAVSEIKPINLQEKDVIVIGGIGRLDKSKGFRYAINAIKQLETLSNKKFIFKLAGEGPREPFLRNIVKANKQEEVVEFLGWIKNKKEFFSNIDILTFTSERETFGLVLLEAMKYGKPIISTNADGPQEILRPEKDALMVKLYPEDDNKVATQFAQAILLLTNEEGLAEKLAKNSLERVKEKFSTKALENKLAEIVGRVGGR